MSPYYEHAGITIYHGDCREVLPAARVSAIVTDPPYARDFIPILKECLGFADQWLVPQASIFAMVGQIDLPATLEAFSLWDYLWCGCFENKQMNGAIWP